LFGLILTAPQDALAQQREIFDFFGGMIRSGIAAATQAEWQRLPNSEIACMDGALRQRGSSVNEAIRQGISPSDPRMSALRGGCRGQAIRSAPSFDCRRARYADEIAICSDPELARLDRLIGDGYQDLVARLGEGIARSVAAPMLAARRNCGPDATCIRRIQLSTIGELQRRGASIENADAVPASPAPLAQTPVSDSPYVVDGVRLGGRVVPGSSAYLAFRCTPSDQFPGLTRCQRNRQEMAARGPYNSTTTILHSADGTAVYVNRYLEPAFFAGSEAMDDVRRLATKYGEPRYVTAPFVPNAPRTLMATWGDVELQPLDRARLAELAAGRDVRAGILVDHIGNFRRSASMGLPVYQVTGGAGYVWAASWDPLGVGTLRFLAADPSELDPAAPVPGPEIAAAPPVTLQAPPAPAGVPLPSQPESPNDGVSDKAASLPPVVSYDMARASDAPAASSPALTPPPAPRPADQPPARPEAKSVPADQPVQPRVVGPPVTINPVAAKPADANIAQWLLIAVVLVLLAAVGFLLFERQKRTGSPRNAMIAPPRLPEGEAETKAATSSGEAVEIKEPAPEALAMTEPPALPIALPALAEAASEQADAAGPAGIEQAAGVPSALQTEAPRPATSIVEHRHFGIGLLIALVTLPALMSFAVGPAGLIPLALAIYLIPTIIAFKVRHHYAWVLAIINVIFGFTVLGWLGIFVWALIGPRKSALDNMSQHSALGIAKTSTGDPAAEMSDANLRSGWKMPVVQAEIFSFEGSGAPVEAADTIQVFFKNPVIGLWRSGPASSGVRYNAATQIRCVARIAAETKLRVGRTLGRTALTGIGAAILTGRQNALGAAFLDYRFSGDETDEMIAALIVFSDYSSIVIQSERDEFEKFCALLPPHILSEEVEAETAEEIDRIRRMAADGPRVIEEMRAVIADTEISVMRFSDQAQNGGTFAERDEGRTGLLQAEERLAHERAVLNAVDRLIRLAGHRDRGDRRIA
jgi:hypothetical protein